MPTPETCDRCTRVATHELCETGGRVKLCCEHYVAHPDSSPASYHPECVTHGARATGRPAPEYQQDLLKKERRAGDFW